MTMVHSAQEDEEGEGGSCGISRCIVAVSPCAAEKCIKVIFLAADTPLNVSQEMEISATGLW